MFWRKTAIVLSCLPLLSACRTRHEVETKSKIELEVKPMHITIDVIVKVDRELDNFFGDLDDKNTTMKGMDQ